MNYIIEYGSVNCVTNDGKQILRMIQGDEWESDLYDSEQL